MKLQTSPIIDVSAADGGSSQRLYDPKSWGELTVASKADPPHVPRHWRGVVPDPDVVRWRPRGPGDVSVPHGLLTSKLSNLQVLLWAQLTSWFYYDEGETDYEELACELLGSPTTPAKSARIGAAMRPMVGTWVLRRRGQNGRCLYQTGMGFATSDPWSLMRGEFLAELGQTGQAGPDPHHLADIVNFTRWQLECGERGWTIETADRLSQEWQISSTRVVASRERLSRLGWLTTIERSPAETGPLVWITEQYDPQQALVEITSSHRERSASYWQFPKDLVEVIDSRGRSYMRHPVETVSLDDETENDPPAEVSDPSALNADLGVVQDHLHANFEWQLVTVTFAELNELLEGLLPAQHLESQAWWEQVITSRRWQRVTKGRTTEIDLHRRELRFRSTGGPQLLTVDGLRHRRSHRRRRAFADLIAPRRHGLDPTQKWQAHEVYLLHFPAERCFKVGLTRSGSGRIEAFVRRGGIVIQRVEVENGPLAEIVEADALTLAEEWHRPGDPHRAGGGYTEMWSDSGPTIDLNGLARQAADRLAALTDLLDEAGGSR
jgi:hypothetical protein